MIVETLIITGLTFLCALRRMQHRYETRCAPQAEEQSRKQRERGGVALQMKVR